MTYKTKWWGWGPVPAVQTPRPPRRPRGYRPRHARQRQPLIHRGHRFLAAAYLMVATLTGSGLAIAQQASHVV